MKALIDAGSLKPSDMVLEEDAEKWIQANSVKVLGFM